MGDEPEEAIECMFEADVDGDHKGPFEQCDHCGEFICHTCLEDFGEEHYDECLMEYYSESHR